MARKRPTKTSRNVLIGAFVVVVVVGYLMLRSGAPGSESTPSAAADSENGTVLTGVADEENSLLDNSRKDAEAKPDGMLGAADQDIDSPAHSAGLPLFTSARHSESSGELLAARAGYTQAIQGGLPAEQRREALDRLNRLAEETLYGPKRLPGDPLVATHNVQPGDTLSKIAKNYQVTAQLLARVNRLADVDRIRAGQNLKVLHGPFSVEISKGTYEMFVYLQGTLVRHYKVGLGVDGSTPSGGWSVKNKLINPTYYPPRGGSVVQADDPENPLGERWIGLDGVSGEAVGQLRYGIHGTNDPETVGRSESLGCVRMYNEDVEWLFDMLVEGRSQVTITE